MNAEQEELNRITAEIIGAAIEVHRQLRPGLLESTYQACLAWELTQGGLKFQAEKALPVRYKGVDLECGYRLDFLVEGEVVVEVKCVDALAPIHEAQLLSYLKLSNRRVGLLINFNVRILRNGVKRIVNRF